MDIIMRTVFFGLFCALLTAAAPVLADERQKLGIGRMLTNDVLGDGQDRWRSGSYALSFVRGRNPWNGKRPVSFGDIIEYRIRGEVFAPEDIQTPAAGDRRFAGAWSVGMHTHFRRHNIEISAGADLVMTGKQTGLGQMQREFHKVLGVTGPSGLLLNNQIANGFHPTASVEIANPLSLSHHLRFRPFIEARIGDEDLMRIGGDFTFGSFGRDDLMLRDVSTGQLYPGTKVFNEGISLMLGGDVAKVYGSVYLPASAGFTLTDTRSRLRAGVNYQRGQFGAFYGMTWLGKEFVDQRESQILGSIRLSWRF